MPEPFCDNFRVNLINKKNRGVCMSQIVKANLWKTGFLENRPIIAIGKIGNGIGVPKSVQNTRSFFSHVKPFLKRISVCFL